MRAEKKFNLKSVFAERLFLVREAKGYTQQDMYYQTGIPECEISRMECAKRCPSASTIVRLCEALKCSADYLLGLSNDPV